MRPRPESRLQIAPDVMVQAVGRESVLLDLGSQQYFLLDAVGTRAWQLLAEHGRLSAVWERMTGEYDVERDVLELDLLELAEELLAAGLILFEDATDPDVAAVQAPGA